MDSSRAIGADAQTVAVKRPFGIWLRWVLLVVAAVFYVLHFVHLDADFPSHSPWVDWSKFTDEGWYSDAAVRHFLTGHWYLKGDFNPAVALPMWPAVEWVFFCFAGVSMPSARALAVLMFGVTLVAMYFLIERHTRAHDTESGHSLAAPTCALMLCCSPFVYAFERMAIVEPLLIALITLAVLVASHLRPVRVRDWRALLPQLALGVLMPAMVLTKTTALFLLPALAYTVWARAGYRLWRAVQLAWLPCVMGVALWCAYFFGFVRPHYLEDYRYIFSANAYTSAASEPLHLLIVQTVGNTVWMGVTVYALVFVVIGLAVLWRSHLFKNPLVPTMLLWATGYLAFIGYHFNQQPRYYLVVAVPLTAFVAMGLDSFRLAGSKRWVSEAAVVLCVLGVLVPDAVRQMRYVLHPEYTFRAAAEGIQRIVLSDANHSHLVLSISGSDLTLMTGLPSICDDFGTMTLDERVKVYRPGWYASWNELDDDKMDALSPLVAPVRVAQFAAMDDQDRNLLILYRLDPAAPGARVKRRRVSLSKAMQAKPGTEH